ncbi:MAG: hypothetical protein ACK5H1_08790 [Tenacibaculum sp.]
MDSISNIYTNNIGVSFRWKGVSSNLTQIIFKDTGFYLSTQQIELFIDKIQHAKLQETCPSCKSILLLTPINSVSLAVSKAELVQIEDLLIGTLFQIKMNDYLNYLCKN